MSVSKRLGAILLLLFTSGTAGVAENWLKAGTDEIGDAHVDFDSITKEPEGLLHYFYSSDVNGVIVREVAIDCNQDHPREKLMVSERQLVDSKGKSLIRNWEVLEIHSGSLLGQSALYVCSQY